MDNNDFFSINRLVEFGMSMAIANQMIGMMNQSMRNMYVPGAQMQLNSTPKNIYVNINDTRVGPINASEFSQMVSNHTVTKDTMAWIPTMTAWRPVIEIPELLKLVALIPNSI